MSELSIKTVLQKKHLFPLVLFLFPAFYLCNLQNQFSGILTISTISVYYFSWTALLLIFYWICLGWLKKPQASALLVLFAGFVYFYAFPLAIFFRNIRFLQLLNSFTWLTSVWLVLTLLLVLWIKNSKGDWVKTAFWMRTTLLVLLSYELILASSMHIRNRNLNFDKAYRPEKPAFVTATPAIKPNIYFLVYDGFTSTSVLESEFGYKAGWLEDSLKKQGFQFGSNSTSNYLLSPVSVAATLNMGYLPIQSSANRMEELILLYGLKNLNNNHLFGYLRTQHYRIVNLSIFSIDSSITPLWSSYPGSSDADLIQMKTLSNTKLPGSVSQLFRTQKEKFFDRKVFNIKENIRLTEEGLQLLLHQKEKQPYFVYIHEIIPHHPYVFDSTGRYYDLPVVNPADTDAYLQQLVHTSRLLLKRVQQIRQEDPNGIIILQGDHGYRHYQKKNNPHAPFGILNAICFPGRETKSFYNSVSSVNTFRILLNEYFYQQLPLLNDSLFELNQFQKQLSFSP